MALQFLGSASDSNLDSIDVKRVSVVTRQVDPPLTFVRNDECFAEVANAGGVIVARLVCRPDPVGGWNRIGLRCGKTPKHAGGEQSQQAGDQKIKL